MTVRRSACFMCLAFLLTSCASQRFVPGAANPFTNYLYGSPEGFKMDMSAPLGPIGGSPADPRAFGFMEYGLAAEAKLDLLNQNQHSVKNAGLIFPSSREKIFWYAHFDTLGSMKNQASRKYWIQWFSPDGKLYYQEEFKVSLAYPKFAKTKLEFPRPFPETLAGKWRVRVGRKEQVGDDRYFRIVQTT